MKALTIYQPYAHLICLPDDDDRAKRVENRRWATSYRGPLLIHAGKSRDYLDLDVSGKRDEGYGINLDEMTFGAIVGVANLADCVRIDWDDKGDWSKRTIAEHSQRRWPWLLRHEHTEGPFCFVLTECRRFETPIPYRGAQGFFEVKQEIIAKMLPQSV
jgi:activating signal cointegrator 1